MHVSWKHAPASEAADGLSPQTARGRWALVPAKPFALAKTRLSARLAPRHRAALAREMLIHTLRVLGQVETLEGVALVSTFAVVDDLKAGRLVRPFDLEIQAGFSYWLVCPNENLRRAKVKAFCDWLLEEAAKDSTAKALEAEEALADRSNLSR